MASIGRILLLKHNQLIMRALKIITALIFSFPLVYLPLEMVSNNDTEPKDEKAFHFKAEVFGEDVWGTENFRIQSDGFSQALFSYEQALKSIPEEWDIPDYEEAQKWLKELGFNERRRGVVNSNYYKINWNYMGYVDPILGKMAEGDKLLFWIKDDGIRNYIVIEKDQLTYSAGKTLPQAKLALFLKK